jgi:hypothetical protein
MGRRGHGPSADGRPCQSRPALSTDWGEFSISSAIICDYLPTAEGLRPAPQNNFTFFRKGGSFCSARFAFFSAGTLGIARWEQVAQTCSLGLRLFRSYRNGRYPSADGRPSSSFPSRAAAGRAEPRRDESRRVENTIFIKFRGPKALRDRPKAGSADLFFRSAAFQIVSKRPPPVSRRATLQ